MPHLHVAPSKSVDRHNHLHRDGGNHHDHDGTTSMLPSSPGDVLAEDMPIQEATKGYFGMSDPGVLELARKSNCNAAVIDSFDSTTTDSSTFNAASSPPTRLTNTGRSTDDASTGNFMITPSPPKLAASPGTGVETTKPKPRRNDGRDDRNTGGPSLTIYGSQRWAHSPVQVQRRVVSQEDEERPDEEDGWKTASRNKYGYQYNYGKHCPTNLRFAPDPVFHDPNLSLRHDDSLSSHSPSQEPTAGDKRPSEDRNEFSSPDNNPDTATDADLVKPGGARPQQKKAKAQMESEHRKHETGDNKMDSRSSNGTGRTTTASNKRASPPAHDHPFPQSSSYGHRPPESHHSHHHAPPHHGHRGYHHLHSGSFHSADSGYRHCHHDPHHHNHHHNHHRRHHNDHHHRHLHMCHPPPPSQGLRDDRHNNHHYYPYHHDPHIYHHSSSRVGGSGSDSALGGRPSFYPPPSYHQQHPHGGVSAYHGPTSYGAGSTFQSVYPSSHAGRQSNQNPTSTNRCVKLEEPIPPKSAWSDVGKALEVVLPDFHRLVNYPDYLTKGSSRLNPAADGGIDNSADVNTDGRRHCVMCGKLRICSAASLVQSQKVRPIKSAEVGSGSSDNDSTDEKDDGTTHIIPRQNKGLCTACDVTVWVMASNGMEIKWCKGCKNFKPWAGFGTKGLATKCVRCRDRQREKYAAQNKTRPHQASSSHGDGTTSRSQSISPSVADGRQENRDTSVTRNIHNLIQAAATSSSENVWTVRIPNNG